MWYPEYKLNNWSGDKSYHVFKGNMWIDQTLKVSNLKLKKTYRFNSHVFDYKSYLPKSHNLSTEAESLLIALENLN